MIARVSEVISPVQAMQLAIEEAKKGAGFVSPNPLVGCVIVDREHRLLGYGHHARVGHDHAEVHALKSVSDQSRLEGARFYVTLEPCAHEGRTPSCAKALAKLPIRSVVFGLVDPFPQVSGKGAEILRAAGKEVCEWRSLEDASEASRAEVIAELEDLSEIFLHNHRRGKPFVAIKVATSLDGMMALRSGESKWITGEESRLHAHFLRGSYDSVLVGQRTFMMDNPFLNVRHPLFPGKKTRPILMDPQGKTLRRMKQSNMYSVHDPQDIFVVINQFLPEKQAKEIQELAGELGIHLLPTPLSSDGSFEIDVLLKTLWDRGMRSVFVEGGSHAIGCFLRNKCAQRLHLFVAPVIMGAKYSLGWTETFGIAHMAEKIELVRPRSQQIGKDVYLTGKIP